MRLNICRSTNKSQFFKLSCSTTKSAAILRPDKQPIIIRGHLIISLAGLNSEQRIAAETVEGPVLILAGAGTGKTRTVTYRIAHMVDNLAIPGKNILGVSFTNKAAKEMRERVVTLLGKRKARGVTLTTFHSLGVRILKKEITKLGYHKNFSIYDSGDQLALIREALKLFKAEKTYDRKRILSKISQLKNMGISEDEYGHSPYYDPSEPYDVAAEHVYHFYQDKLRFCNAIDFDDILFLTVKLFDNHPEVAKKYSELYQFIMIDEYQDTNSLQLQLIVALTSTHKNLCVVGDDDQSIYAFRGADVSNILHFQKYFPGAKVIKLEENYRSTQPILNLANEVIKQNTKRMDKTLRSDKEDDQLPILWAMADSDHEGEVIAEEIAKHQAEGGHLGDVAVLYRSKTQIPAIEDALRINQVPYSILGGQKLYEKKEVKDLIAYLCLIINLDDELSMRRILNVPHRGIGTATLQKYLDHKEEAKLNLFDSMEQNSDFVPNRKEKIQKFSKLIRRYQGLFANGHLLETLSKLIEEIEYYKYIQSHYDENPKAAARRKNDIMMFLQSAERFDRFFHGKAKLKDFVSKLLLQDGQDQSDEDEDDDIRKNEVTLMTLHSSKGLEFEIVYFMGAEEELIPHKKTIHEGGDINEELRLFYVGVTRAKERLYMSYCKERKLYGRIQPCHKSRFLEHLKQIPDQKFFLEQDRTTFGHMAPEEAENYKKDFFSSLADKLE